MATTQFFMTMDGKDTSYPDEQDFSSAKSDKGQNVGRYDAAGLGGAKLRFPLTTDSFNTPYVKFYFLDAYGNIIENSPKVNLRMPSVFNISNFSDYSRTDQIVSGSGGKDGSVSKALFNVGTTGLAGLAGSAQETVSNMAEAIAYSLRKGFAASTGFVESMGLSGINQFEFSNRQAINPMAQLLYKGPQYRKYQIPVPMKPRNKEEAKEIQKIIKAFRVASSPSYSASTVASGLEAALLGSEDGKSFLTNTSFTFGYPHLVGFNIEFYENENKTIKILYKSKACALESVSVDYGGQKITFFEDGIPTEMNLTLQLSEVVARTLGDEMSKSNDFTIF